MKLRRFAVLGLSVALLALVSSVAVWCFYACWRAQRGWTRAVVTEAAPPLRGHYLWLQLNVDGCQSTLPSAKLAEFPRNYSVAVKPGPYRVRQTVNFRARLKIIDGRLAAVRAEGVENAEQGEWITAAAGAFCDQMQLQRPVGFFIARSTKKLLPLGSDQQLWVEVAVPPNGAPLPLQLAVSANGLWRPLTSK
jgi:hypothetical protein